jgi:hypothetical protein
MSGSGVALRVLVTAPRRAKSPSRVGTASAAIHSSKRAARGMRSLIIIKENPFTYVRSRKVKKKGQRRKALGRRGRRR